MRRLAVSLLSVPFLLLAAACSQEVGLIDRTQPGLLSKSIFIGDPEQPDTQQWFIRRTVTDVPYDVGYTFIGETEEAYRIRWDIQRDQLLAFRTHPHVEGTPDTAPVAVFAIKGHADVFREYNPSTGEQTNVLSENTTDRPWYEREFIRVDWSKNLVTNFGFYVDHLELDAVAYVPEDARDENRPLIGVKQADGSWRDVQDEAQLRSIRDAQYLDIVTKVSVKPESVEFEDWSGNLFVEPACWYYFNYDCAPGLITIRNSFLRVDAALSNYEPLHYPDVQAPRDESGEQIRVKWNAQGNLERVDSTPDHIGPRGQQGNPGGDGDVADPYADSDASLSRLSFFDKFGYFRVERFGYDPQYGEVESNRVYWATRWNIWDKSYDDDGAPLEYRKRGFKPIVYYLSPEFPVYLLPEAQKVAEQWSEAFQRTAESLGAEDVPLLFEIRQNTREVDPDTGEVITRGEVMGDLRYSHLWYVKEPTRAGLLGYGPSAADPNTGEIFSAAAYVYGAGIKEFAAMGKDIVAVLNGDVSPEELALGEDVKSYLNLLKQQMAAGNGAAGAGGKRPARKDLEEFAHKHRGAAPPQKPGKGALPSHGADDMKLPPPHKRPKAKPQGIDRLLRPAGWIQSRLDKVRDTALETLLVSDPALIGLKGGGRVDPEILASGMPAGLRERVSPVHWSGPQHRRAVLARFRSYAKRNMMMASFYDEAVAGLALELAAQDAEDVFTTIERKIFRATAEHEVGHTIGLRHNFEASSDALNYHDEYWDLRGDNPAFLAPLSDDEVNGKLREYQYSSIMDYAGRFNTDTAGLGKYDHAAIAFGYGQLVEVFDEIPGEPMMALEEYAGGAYDRAFTLDTILRDYRHYTSIPSMFGGRDKMRARKLIPYTAHVEKLMNADPNTSMEARLTGKGPWAQEVPYRFCSDEYDFGTGTCHTFDTGADAYEVVLDSINRYENYYWFKNFKRDRVFFDEWDYMDGLYWRVFGYIQNAYQNWVFDQWFKADDWEWMRNYADDYAIEDLPWTDAKDGGQEQTAAVREGVAFLMRVLAKPEPGAYMYDFDENYYWAFSSDQSLPICQSEWSFYSNDYCSDANIALGDGRYFYSLFDVESGYYFYERLKWICSFYDKLLALETLTSPDTYFLGVDQFQSVDAWALSMYTSFGEEIQRVFSGIAADKFTHFAGRFDSELTYVPPDIFNMPAASNQPEDGAVDPSTSFTIQLYALWYGMAWLNANYDNSFNDGAKIWLKGSGEAIELPAGADVVEFENPFNNRIYVATRPSGPTAAEPVGWTMLTTANDLAQRYNQAAANPNTAASTLEYQKWRVTNITENIEVVRGLYDMYGYLYF